MIAAAGQNGVDVLILDTAPNADQVASLAARAADLVLIPSRPAIFDLEAIETTLLLVRAAIQSGSVDAWAIWDPYYAAAEVDGQVRVLRNGEGLSAHREFYLPQ